ncbi:hypothetical protein FHX81_3472 [Saccharothrix saharensis]|uniref:Uncharacterized protein n=1 Tax=Saccharothrix saharensis TaxID=571190 RepID=A0A543JE88_9PSEU|nr:hypothetical protein [Saccharothrix saharensis]TQM81111.1 hypothetical protein FHX81_3472 [Saccharothrix saharensis]
MSGARRVGKVKVKKKCCRSTPRCKSCPVVVLLKAREKAAKKAAKAAKKERKEEKEKGKKKTAA